MENRYFNAIDYDKLIYFQMPKILMYGEKYEKLSNDAKMLYMICFDLTKVSMSNHGKKDRYGNILNWKDEKGFYIKMSNEKIEKVMKCGTTKAVKLKKELQKFGLLEQKRVGLNKANLLYVLQLEYSENDIYTVNQLHENMLDEEPGEMKEGKKEESEPLGDQRNFKNRNSGISECESQEFQNVKPINNKITKNEHIENKQKDQYQYLSEYIWKMNIPLPLKRFFKDKVKVLVDDYPSFDLSTIEYVYNSYVGFIKPDCSRYDSMYLNDIEFSNTIKKLYIELSKDKKHIENMEGLIKKWVMNGISFKMENIDEAAAADSLEMSTGRI